MGMLDQFTPTQRTALLIGVPVIGGVVLLQTMRPTPEPVEDPPNAADPTGTVGAYMPTTGVVGTGELGDMVSGITNTLLGLTQSVQDLESKAATTPPAAASTQPADWNKVGGSPPIDRNGKLIALFGKRSFTVPSGGRRLDVLARMLYSSSKYVGHLHYANADKFPGGATPTTHVAGGTTLRY